MIRFPASHNYSMWGKFSYGWIPSQEHPDQLIDKKIVLMLSRENLLEQPMNENHDSKCTLEELLYHNKVGMSLEEHLLDQPTDEDAQGWPSNDNEVDMPSSEQDPLDWPCDNSDVTISSPEQPPASWPFQNQLHCQALDENGQASDEDRIIDMLSQQQPPPGWPYYVEDRILSQEQLHDQALNNEVDMFSQHHPPSWPFYIGDGTPSQRQRPFGRTFYDRDSTSVQEQLQYYGQRFDDSDVGEFPRREHSLDWGSPDGSSYDIGEGSSNPNRSTGPNWQNDSLAIADDESMGDGEPRDDEESMDDGNLGDDESTDDDSIDEDDLTPQEIWEAKYGGTIIHPERTLLSVELNAAVETEREIAGICSVNSGGGWVRGDRVQLFYQRLHFWIERLEEKFCRDVCGWALRYCPERHVFGLVTDISRVAFMLIYRKSERLSTDDLEILQEMLAALKMWAFYNDVELPPLTVWAAGGDSLQGIKNLATICATQETRQFSCPALERRAAWNGIIHLSMGLMAEEMKIPVTRVVFNMLENVLPNWKWEVNLEKRRLRDRVIHQFIRASRYF